MPSRGIPNEELFLTRPSNTPTPDSPTIEPLRIHKPTSPKPHHPQYPTPPISAPPAPFASAPAFSLSSGALSSANMISLPYPDEEDAAPVSLAAYQNGPRLGSPSEQKGPGLAQRRGTAPKPLSGPSSPSDELFIRPTQPTVAPSTSVHYPSLSKPVAPEPQGVNRFASTASTSTTRASRGSPPPPETPIVEPGETPASNIEARFAVPGISAQQNTQSAAASQRLAQYGSIPQPQSQAQQATRPWTPTEVPGAGPHGPPTVYQGSAPVQESHGAVPSSSSKPSIPQDTSNLQVSVLEQDFQRLGTKTPPPAYSSVTNGSARPQEKQRPENPATATVASPRQQSHQPQLSISTQLPAIQPVPQLQPQPQQATQLSKADMVAQAAAAAAASAGMASHPAFANDPGNPATGTGTIQMVSSPPPLPEGWMAHLDQNSGQYYYIHIATQATQWEFPKGPNPINHDVAPLSPTASTYGNPLASPLLTGKASMASPMFAPQTPGYAESIMSVAHSTAPSAAGFSGPPPSSGVELYKVAPTNGVYFGPYLRYINMDVTRGIWYGSILIVTDSPQPPSIHIHLSQDLSPNPRQLTPTRLAVHQRWIFWKYTIDLPMSEKGTERWTYAVTSHMGCTRYEFVVAGKHEVSWRFIAHSNNDFAPTTSQTERSKLGGLAFMWKDVLAKNVECGGYHVQLGLGNQIYGDRMWKEIPVLKSWLAMSGKENRRNAAWTARHEEDVSHAYFHYYTSHLDQPFLREAFAQIPHVFSLDDHDIFGGYGSFPDYMHNSAIFRNIGRLAVDMFLLFQHHTTPEILRTYSDDTELFTFTGTGWHFIKYLGPQIVVIGPDCRSERTMAQVMSGPSYQGLLPKLYTLAPSVQHCIFMIPVPLVYPRLEAVESLASAVTTGKKAVNTTYNILGKVTSSVAGVVGGKEVVASGFSHVKKAVGKQGFMGTVLNSFGDIDVAEELKDLWTHERKEHERTYLIRSLQTIAQQKGLRMTFLSGDVTSCGAGLVHDPQRPRDHKTMYQIITSPIVAAPQSPYVLKMLHNNPNKPLYIPQTGQRTTNEVSDTKEDMMEIFHTDASGTQRELKRLMGRRNYISVTSIESDYVDAIQQHQSNGTLAAMAMVQPPVTGPGSKLTIQVDFVVQGDGAYMAPTKYGPVYLPHLELGH